MSKRTTISRRVFQCLLALCFSSCGGIQNSINPAGPQAENLSRLWWLMFIVSSIVFVLVMIALLLALRKRVPETDTAPMLEPPAAP
jgi:heme/copper-type cytochrome/quinol oxidase subunit 2